MDLRGRPPGGRVGELSLALDPVTLRRLSRQGIVYRDIGVGLACRATSGAYDALPFGYRLRTQVPLPSGCRVLIPPGRPITACRHEELTCP